MCQGHASDQSGVASKRDVLYLAITASGYKMAVLIMSLNYKTHHHTNAPQNTPHKNSPREGLQSLIALFLVFILQSAGKRVDQTL